MRRHQVVTSGPEWTEALEAPNGVKTTSPIIAVQCISFIACPGNSDTGWSKKTIWNTPKMWGKNAAKTL